jgi:hypothetical protein
LADHLIKPDRDHFVFVKNSDFRTAAVDLAARLVRYPRVDFSDSERRKVDPTWPWTFNGTKHRMTGIDGKDDLSWNQVRRVIAGSEVRRIGRRNQQRPVSQAKGLEHPIEHPKL